MTPHLSDRKRRTAEQKAAARLAYSNRQLRRRLAALERAAGDENRLPTEPSPRGYAAMRNATSSGPVRRFDRAYAEFADYFALLGTVGGAIRSCIRGRATTSTNAAAPIPTASPASTSST